MSFGAEFIGRVLGGRYRLVAAVGTGASATVFQADDVLLRRTVAVKVLHPSLAADPSFLRRFRAEAQAAAALSHPNVLAIFDWGEDDGQPYLVMEFLGGGSLRSMLDVGRRLTPSQALLVGLEATRGLDYAHRRGFVHRDIKPANLLFGEDGRLRIADFGLARALAEAAWTEPAGVVLGTARYASPEQARGLPVDGKTDVYSLALTLVEAITGQVPFAADTTVATLQNRIDKLMPVSAELGALASVIERAGRPDPAERSDAAELGKALISVAERLPRPERLPLVRTLITSDQTNATAIAPTRADAPFPGTEPLAPIGGPGVVGAEALGAGAAAPPIGPGGPGAVAAGTAGSRGREPRRGRRAPRATKFFLIVLALVVVAGGVAAGAVALTSRNSSTKYPVPVLTQMTEDRARNAVTPYGFVIGPPVTTRQDGTQAGDVVAQDPPAGTMLKKGSIIRITISQGPTQAPVPDLTGKSEADARTAVTSAGFTVGDVKHVNDEATKPSTVLLWSLKGETVTKGTAVDLTISDGPAPRKVPTDLVGKPVADVMARLSAPSPGLQLVPTESDQFDDNIPAGVVISVSPAGGATIARDGAITVVVSKGPELVPVPVLGGKTITEAVALIRGANLKDGNVTGPAAGRVVSSTPAAGEMVKKGTKVDIRTG